MGERVQKIKGFVEDIGDTSVAAIKARLREGLEGRTQAWLAEKTGDTPNDVGRWLRTKAGDEEKDRPPVDFVARYCIATHNSADWVICGIGPMRAFPPGEAQEALARIIGQIPPHLLTFVRRSEE